MAGARIPGAEAPTVREPSGWGEPFFERASQPGPIGLDASTSRSIDDSLPFGSDGPELPGAEPAHPKTPEGDSRGLTVNERAMARSIFGDSIDYGEVRVHNEEYLWFGLQPDDIAMTPNGEMYFNPKHFKEDFALSSFSDALWFMHEMVHVWQYQLGYPVMLRGAIRIGLDYEYVLDASKLLSDYDMEAQGDLLADYWALKNFGTPPAMRQWTYSRNLPLYEIVLRKFIADPSDEDNLP